MTPAARAAAACFVLLSGSAARAGDVEFTRDVVPALSKGGCNMGACHGNLNGKGGFRLSLRGENPDFDYAALSRDMQGRRIDTQRPDESLVLRKASATVPHEGGRRFGPESEAYRLLARWVADGARRDPAGAAKLVGLDATPGDAVLVEPADRLEVRATARFSDGTSRDVTALAVLESTNPAAAEVDAGGAVRKLAAGETTITVRYLHRQTTVRVAFVPARPGFVWPDPPENDFVDRHVFAKLKKLRQAPSDLAPDHVFLRRVYLDAVGQLPAVEESRRFLADARPDKRDRLIDDLTTRPEFADLWALKWADLLRAEEKTLDRKGVQAVHLWLRQAVAAGKPLNLAARELVAGRGSTYSNPPANYYRALRDPASRAEATAQVFLGVRIGCAKCHNPPVRPLDDGRLLRPGRVLPARPVPRRVQRPARQPGQARDRRRPNRGTWTAPGRRPTRAPAPTPPRHSWAPAARRPPARTGWRPWPTGSATRTTRSSPAPRPTASGITSWARGWSSRTTTSGRRTRRRTRSCSTPWRPTSGRTASTCGTSCAWC